MKIFRRDFSLIELLVVIAIISLLVALSAPSLQKARLRAAAANCTSNLHQIALMTFSYVQNQRDSYPTITLAPAWGGKDGKNGIAAYGWTYLLALDSSSTNPDGYRHLFRCPRENRRTFSYCMNVRELALNGKDGGSANNHTAWHQTELSKSRMALSRLILIEESPEAAFTLTDCDQDNYSDRCTSSDNRRHGNINLLFADGHVGAMNYFNAEDMTYFTTEMSGWK